MQAKDPIVGNNLYTSIAWQAKSPTNAAKLARYLGLPSHIVRAIRNAAKLKRDEGEEAFKERYSPWEQIDVRPLLVKRISFEVTFKDAEGYRPINAAEANWIVSQIKQTLERHNLQIRARRFPISHEQNGIT